VALAHEHCIAERPGALFSRAKAVWLEGLLLIAALMAVFSLLIVPVHAQELTAGEATSTVQASQENNYGRMVITFKGRNTLPPYTAEVTGGVLLLKFDEPVQADLDEVRLRLDNYITVARIDPDGKALRFALKQSIRMNTMEAGEKLFVDLLPQNWIGMPPGLPPDVVADLAKRAEKAAIEAAEAERRRLLGELDPEVALRVGRHPTFTRLKFDWNIPFKSALERKDDVLSLKFDLRVGIDLSDVITNLPPLVKSIDAMVDNDGLVVALELDSTADVRAFQDGLSYVVDLTSDEMLKFDPLVATARDNLGIERSEQKASLQIQNDLSQEDSKPVVPQSIDGIAQNMPMDVKALVSTPALNGLEAIAQESSQQETGEADVSDDSENTVASAEEKALDEVSEDSDWPQSSNPEQNAAIQDKSLNMLHVDARTFEDRTVRLEFPFTEETAMATFQRSNVLWAVFDTPLQIDGRLIRKETSSFARNVTFERQGQALVMRMELNKPILVTATTRGNSWLLSLGDTIMDPSEQLELSRQNHADNRAFASIDTGAISNIYTLQDPIVGDHIHVVTMPPAPRGFLKPHILAEFELLVTSHGVALISYIDDLQVAYEEGRLTLNRPTGMALSEAGSVYGNASFLETDRVGYIDLSRWQMGGADLYRGNLRAFQEEIAGLEGEQQVNRLLDLGRFFLANDLGQEALGMVRYALQTEPALESDESFQILYAAAHVLADHIDEALAYLNNDIYRTNPDAAVWRVMANTAKENWSGVRADQGLVLAVLDAYPYDVQSRIRLGLTEAALESNDLAGAIRHLGEISPNRLGNLQRAHYFIQAARIANAQGNQPQALENLAMAEELDAGPEAAKATLQRIQMLYSDQKLSDEEAIAQLEQLTAGWRGDSTELKARNILAGLYTERGDYREAFKTLKDAVMADSDAPVVRDLYDRMTEKFVELFLHGKADDMPVMKSLSLFYDFRELTPIGRKGDELVRRMSDRLVEVDLLKQAADLLRHQVDNRLTGTAKAQVAADLAVIYLMDHRPHEALSILQRTRLSQLPTDLARQRRKIEARALAETGRVDLALELLRPFTGPDVDTLRADALWEDERWQDAAETLEKMLGQSWAGARPLDQRQKLNVLRSAIAYSLAGDAIGLERLRKKFSRKMADSEHAYAFEVVSANIESRGIAFRDIARQVASVNTLKQFLQEYRDRYKDQPLDS
jgi:tetratricopeptide (TPR) repeat protein